MPGNPPQSKLRSGARRPIPSHVDRSTIEKAAAGPAKEASDAGASSLSAWRERPSGGFVRATPVSEHTLAIQRLRAALLASTAALRRGRRVLPLLVCLPAPCRGAPRLPSAPDHPWAFGSDGGKATRGRAGCGQGLAGCGFARPATRFARPREGGCMQASTARCAPINYPRTDPPLCSRPTPTTDDDGCQTAGVRVQHGGQGRGRGAAPRGARGA